MTSRTSTKKRSTKGRSTLTTENDVAPFPVEQDVPTSRPPRSNVVPFVPRRPPRPSVIVRVGQPMTAPWSDADMRAMFDDHARVPYRLNVGMWIAAWARAVQCGLIIDGGCLTPSARRDPPEELYAALGCSMGCVIGSLVVAIPLGFGFRAGDPDGSPERVTGVGWPGTWGNEGKWGSN